MARKLLTVLVTGALMVGLVSGVTPVAAQTDQSDCSSYEAWVESSPAAENVSDAVGEDAAEEWLRTLYRQSCGEEYQSFTVEYAYGVNATFGESTVISAGVGNPATSEATQEVAVRLDGDVVQRRPVSIPGDDSRVVNFTVPITPELFEGGSASGWVEFSVQTHDYGESAWVYVENETSANASS